jgi:hypothetical protein
VTESRTRILAVVATGLGILATGFNAHLAPQGDGWWRGLTGAPSPTLMACAGLASIAVWILGKTLDVRPFLWMGAGFLPLIPALTGVGAGLLLFSNYAVTLLFAILLGTTLPALVERLKALRPQHVALISFAFFILVGRFLPGPAGPQGDEPHYLLIAESLLRDGDVDLKNQFEERAFSKFTSAPLEPHTAPRSPKEKLYAIHTPGLSALIAPGYALLGFDGARGIVSAIMAVAVGLVFFAARSLFGVETAHAVFLLATFASPLPIYANALFPDSVAVLPVAASLACVLSSRRSLFTLASISIATLPWMHPRFLPLAAVLALAIALKERLSLGRALLGFLPLAASLALLLVHFHSLFGSASLSAAYGPSFSSDVSLSRIPRGAAALLMDRQFGLLLFSPVLLIGLAGLPLLWRRHRPLAILIVSLSAVILAVGASFSMWWGGASAPARFLIGAVPALLVVFGANWDEGDQKVLGRKLLGAATGFGLGVVWLACLAPRALHNRSDGESGLLRLLAPALDLDQFFPSFVVSSGVWLAALWAAVLIASVRRPRFALPVFGAAIALIGLNVSKPLLDPFSSSLRALEAWHDQRRTLGGQDSETAFSLDIPLGRPAWELAPGSTRYSPRFSLPKGLWTLRVLSLGPPNAEALNVVRVALVEGDENRDPLASLMVKVGEDVASMDFSLDQSARRLHVRGEGLQSTTTVRSVQLIPRDLAR